MSQYPTIAAGQRVTAALLQSLLPWEIIKPADTQQASTTALVADPDLQFSGLAIGTYTIEGLLLYTGAAIGTADLKAMMSATVGAVSSGPSWWNLIAPTTGAANALQDVATPFGTSFAYGTPGPTNNLGGQLKASFQVTTANTTVALSWAQNTSNATATTIKAGSYLRLKRTA